MHFVYSGNFLGQVEVSQHDMIRMTMGIHSYEFGWKLTPGQTFQAPEVVLTYSSEGLGKMTRSLHDFYREHLIRSRYKNTERPILIIIGKQRISILQRKSYWILRRLRKTVA